MENMVSTKNGMQNEEPRMVNDEISLKDMVDFLKRYHRLVIVFSIAGLLLSVAYLALTPKKYEARWQMQMAQFVISNSNSNNNNSNNNNNNSEEPAALVQRLRAPTVYSLALRKTCGVDEDGDLKDYLDGMLKADIVRNVVNAVEMKVVSRSSEQAKQCAEAIVTMIVTQQSGLIKDRLAGRQNQLAQYQQALRDEQQQLEKIKNTEIANFGYLSKLDRLSWLRTRVDALQEEAMLSLMRPAKLLAPIYVPHKAVSPKTGLVLMLGFALGLILGLLTALGRAGWRKAA